MKSISLKTALFSGLAFSLFGTTPSVAAPKDSDLVPANKWCVCEYAYEHLNGKDINHPGVFDRIVGPGKYLIENSFGFSSCGSLGSTIGSTYYTRTLGNNPHNIQDLKCTNFVGTYGELNSSPLPQPKMT